MAALTGRSGCPTFLSIAMLVVSLSLIKLLTKQVELCTGDGMGVPGLKRNGQYEAHAAWYSDVARAVEQPD
jgi:hypothetical protein